MFVLSIVWQTSSLAVTSILSECPLLLRTSLSLRQQFLLYLILEQRVSVRVQHTDITSLVLFPYMLDMIFAQIAERIAVSAFPLSHL